MIVLIETLITQLMIFLVRNQRRSRSSRYGVYFIVYPCLRDPILSGIVPLLSSLSQLVPFLTPKYLKPSYSSHLCLSSSPRSSSTFNLSLRQCSQTKFLIFRSIIFLSNDPAIAARSFNMNFWIKQYFWSSSCLILELFCYKMGVFKYLHAMPGA